MMRQLPVTGDVAGPTLPPLHPHRASSTALGAAGATIIQSSSLPSMSVYSNPYLPQPVPHGSIVASPVVPQDTLVSRLPPPQYASFPSGLPSSVSAGLQVAPTVVVEPVVAPPSAAAVRPVTAASDSFPEDEVDALLHWTDGLMDDTMGL